MNKRRLLKWARHLRKENLGVDRFYIGSWYNESSCGTTACAAGLLPLVFPTLWKYVGNVPTLKRYKESNPFYDAKTFFGFEDVKTSLKLMVRSTYPLYEEVKATDVADRIERLVKEGEDKFLFLL